MLMPSRSADTAIAPRMRQYEHVQRRAERSPSVSLAVNRTPPQWQAPLIGSMEAFMHGSLFGIRTNNYTLSTPPARPMRASALLAANDRFRQTRTPARLVSGRAALSPAHRQQLAAQKQLLIAPRPISATEPCVAEMSTTPFGK